MRQLGGTGTKVLRSQQRLKISAFIVSSPKLKAAGAAPQSIESLARSRHSSLTINILVESSTTKVQSEHSSTFLGNFLRLFADHIATPASMVWSGLFEIH